MNSNTRVSTPESLEPQEPVSNLGKVIYIHEYPDHYIPETLSICWNQHHETPILPVHADLSRFAFDENLCRLYLYQIKTKFPKDDLTVCLDIHHLSDLFATNLVKLVDRVFHQSVKIVVIHNSTLPLQSLESRAIRASFPFELEAILSAIELALPKREPDQSSLESKSKPTHKHLPISIALLIAAGICPADIYLKLSETNFVRIFKKGIEIRDNEKNFFEQKSIDQVWLKIADSDSASKALLKRLFENQLDALKFNEDLSKFKFDSLTVEYFTDWFQVPTKANEMAEKNFRIGLGALSVSPSMKYFFNEFTQASSNHRFTYSYLVTVIASSLGMTIYKFDERKLRALSYAALLISAGQDEVEFQTRWNMMMARLIMGDDVNKNLTQRLNHAVNVASSWELCPTKVNDIISSSEAQFSQNFSEIDLEEVNAVFIASSEFANLVYERSQVDVVTELQRKVSLYKQPKLQEVFRYLIQWTRQIQKFNEADADEVASNQ